MAYRSSQFGRRRDVDRLFDDLAGSDGNEGATPAANVREDDAAIVIELEVPGVRPNDIEVTAEHGAVTIRGEKRTAEQGTPEGRYYVVERSHGPFARSFALPAGVDERRIEAELCDGVLMVRVPKTSVTHPQRVEVRNRANPRE